MDLRGFDRLPPLMTILEVMRELDLFLETSLGKYLRIYWKISSRSIRAAKLKKVDHPKVERKPAAERAIEEGIFLLQNKGAAQDVAHHQTGQ